MNLTNILLRPIPDQTAARASKADFRQYPLKLEGARNDEPLVDIGLYGIAGQSYYSRPNAATDEPVPGVAPSVLVRESIAERLSSINYALQQSKEVTALLGGKTELYVNEGYRSRKLQRQLYQETFPELIRTQSPELSDKQVLARRDELIAEPPRVGSPSPHATGAAIDIRLRYSQPEPGFQPHTEVPMARQKPDISLTANPDYYEHQNKLSAKDKELQRNRRIFYWVMRGALIDEDSGFVVNPTEWWHWSYGDQLWARLTNAPEAFFSIAPEPQV